MKFLKWPRLYNIFITILYYLISAYDQERAWTESHNPRHESMYNINMTSTGNNPHGTLSSQQDGTSSSTCLHQQQQHYRGHFYQDTMPNYNCGSMDSSMTDWSMMTSSYGAENCTNSTINLKTSPGIKSSESDMGDPESQQLAMQCKESPSITQHPLSKEPFDWMKKREYPPTASRGMCTMYLITIRTMECIIGNGQSIFQIGFNIYMCKSHKFESILQV